MAALISLSLSFSLSSSRRRRLGVDAGYPERHRRAQHRRRETSRGCVRAGHWLILISARRQYARHLGLVVVAVEAREAVAVHLLEGFVVRRHDGLSAPRRLRLARGARGTALRCALSMRPAASGIGHGSVSCRGRSEIAVCLVLPRVQFRQPLRALRGLAGGAVVVRRSCANQFRRVRPAGPCLRASELHSGWGVGVRKNLLGFRPFWRKEF